MNAKNTELSNDLNNLAGDLESTGLDLDDLRQMVEDPETIKYEIEGLKTGMQIIRHFMSGIISKVTLDETSDQSDSNNL